MCIIFLYFIFMKYFLMLIWIIHLKLWFIFLSFRKMVVNKNGSKNKTVNAKGEITNKSISIKTDDWYQVMKHIGIKKYNIYHVVKSYNHLCWYLGGMAPLLWALVIMCTVYSISQVMMLLRWALRVRYPPVLLSIIIHNKSWTIAPFVVNLWKLPKIIVYKGGVEVGTQYCDSFVVMYMGHCQVSPKIISIYRKLKEWMVTVQRCHLVCPLLQFIRCPCREGRRCLCEIHGRTKNNKYGWFGIHMTWCCN